MSAPISPGELQQRQGEQVGRDRDDRAPLVRRLDDRATEVADAPGRSRVLQQDAEDVAVGQSVRVHVGDDDLDAERLGPGLHDGERLRQHVARRRRTRRRPAALLVRRASVIASAAAVASSSSEALATGRPVRSVTIVWKLSSASSRPWVISGWYGV